MFDLIELFTHWQAGRSQCSCRQSLGIDRKTIRKYLAPAIAEWYRARRGATDRRAVGGANRGWFPGAG